MTDRHPLGRQETFWSSPNDDVGRADGVARLREMAPALIVLEATGGYEAVLAAHLIDARLLALYAKRMRPLKDEQSRELDALFIRRRQLVDMLIMEKNRLGLSAKRVRKPLAPHYE